MLIQRVSYSGYYVSLPRIRWEFDSPYPHQERSGFCQVVFVLVVREIVVIRYRRRGVRRPKWPAVDRLLPKISRRTSVARCSAWSRPGEVPSGRGACKLLAEEYEVVDRNGNQPIYSKHLDAFVMTGNRLVEVKIAGQSKPADVDTTDSIAMTIASTMKIEL